MRIAGRAFLPEGPRFAALDADSGDGGDPLDWAFGALGVTDRARYLASLFIDDLADVVRDGIDPRFELSRYGEKLASSAATLRSARRRARRAADAGRPTARRPGARAACAPHAPDVVGLTVPFPGNLYGALRIARVAKAQRPAAKVVLGGGYVNTELRDLGEPRVFDYVDFVTLDDGERPSLASSSTCAACPPRPAVPHLRARGGRGRPASRRRAIADLAPPRHRHADVRRAAARSLPVAVRDAESDAPPVVGRPLEQADRRARLLLEEVHVLRRLARLHRALRAGVRGRHSSTGSRRWSRETGRDRVSLRRRGRAARGAARARGALDRAAGRHHLVGQHPLREDASRPSCARCSRGRAASR